MPEMQAVIALSDAEIADFLPGSLWDDLQSLLPGAKRLQLPLANLGEWGQFWRESQIELAVTCWQTPSFNSEWFPNDLRALTYICHLAGTVRRLVPRKLIESGVLVSNWGGSIVPTVAECALMLIFMALRRSSFWAVAMHRDA